MSEFKKDLQAVLSMEMRKQAFAKKIASKLQEIKFGNVKIGDIRVVNHFENHRHKNRKARIARIVAFISNEWNPDVRRYLDCAGFTFDGYLVNADGKAGKLLTSWREIYVWQSVDAFEVQNEDK